MKKAALKKQAVDLNPVSLPLIYLLFSYSPPYRFPLCKFDLFIEPFSLLPTSEILLFTSPDLFLWWDLGSLWSLENVDPTWETTCLLWNLICSSHLVTLSFRSLMYKMKMVVIFSVAEY